MDLAGGGQGAGGALLGIGTQGTGARHAEVAEWEIEAKRIGGIDALEAIRDLPRRGPALRPPPGEAQVSTDPEDVRVQWDAEGDVVD